MRVHLIDGPLSGTSYKFKAVPTSGRLDLTYMGRTFIYRYVEDVEDGWLFRYEREKLWIEKKH